LSRPCLSGIFLLFYHIIKPNAKCFAGGQPQQIRGYYLHPAEQGHHGRALGEMILPPKAPNFNQAIADLVQTRGIDKDI